MLVPALVPRSCVVGAPAKHIGGHNLWHIRHQRSATVAWPILRLSTIFGWCHGIKSHHEKPCNHLKKSAATRNSKVYTIRWHIESHESIPVELPMDMSQCVYVYCWRILRLQPVNPNICFRTASNIQWEKQRFGWSRNIWKLYFSVVCLFFCCCILLLYSVCEFFEQSVRHGCLITEWWDKNIIPERPYIR